MRRRQAAIRKAKDSARTVGSVVGLVCVNTEEWADYAGNLVALVCANTVRTRKSAQQMQGNVVGLGFAFAEEGVTHSKTVIQRTLYYPPPNRTHAGV